MSCVTNVASDGIVFAFQVVVSRKGKDVTHKVVAIKDLAQQLTARGLRKDQVVRVVGELRTRQQKNYPTKTVIELRPSYVSTDEWSVGKPPPQEREPR